MTIVEAIKKAQKTTGTIKRESDPIFLYQPTNKTDCTRMFTVDKGYQGKLYFNFISNRWNPGLKDFLADDWIVGEKLNLDEAFLEP
ncbi:hypothetical protein [Oenococcus oeni]|uniref:hypothetical protein n=1 Tax=Oenococcus oeni TaxID=1247 RepID=UPI000277BB76|nr:hypothetical protein [Oenococcus oeni]EJO04130.1 hypothetical protein AWRIB548_1746 [Oenococcus oeni AWRIB548]EJO04177.1 hypothetical protein AWRIB548_1793 [Oenococcus oeni AWRIB548]KEP86557.1 hypothetical protein X278_02360 [Oenococcus oeni IOEB_0205]KGH66201.1 hypothetical protein X290_08515 [Oenococcus oeni IOEB_B16]OIK70860.1 hypothetical protein ATW70_10075 [Oenococcus oeni]